MPREATLPLLLALAGPTSSGKTTIATALSLIFEPTSLSSGSSLKTNPLIIIHADDFYLPDSQIPRLENGTQNWDCPEALDIPRFRNVLQTVRDGGEVPWDLVRQGGLDDGESGKGTGTLKDLKSEEQKAEEQKLDLDGVHGVKASPISAPKIAALRHRVSRWPIPVKEQRIVMVEGILLFSSQPPLSALTSLFDVKVLLRTARSAAKRRREARDGYVTLEGFWRDPPAYFDEVVWPGFVKAYGELFLEGNVEGLPNQDQVTKSGVEIGPLFGDEIQLQEAGKEGVDLERMLDWIVDLLERALVNSIRS